VGVGAEFTELGVEMEPAKTMVHIINKETWITTENKTFFVVDERFRGQGNACGSGDGSGMEDKDTMVVENGRGFGGGRRWSRITIIDDNH
jgi:hypothetical protein